ncbi:hypothetical protein [Candidatus Magnetobacterium casense]|uniref:Uncharacterized protein n=1 Tax=Candidatus Magnetobacterium casense TaxID=1455061 RepID=A0ABS6S1Z0_9BACT|nr:hypothetical protein [Candidatus Magnetobacterium casensis]MBV6342413.1 hypothetical protein [Candidatus Magnetobacterium casensis]
MKGKLVVHGMVLANKIQYETPGWREKLEEFKAHNEGKNIEITFEMVDSPLHYLFKYYWGYLLPDLAFAMGERNKFKTHLFCKMMHNLINVSTVDEIPKKYFKRGWVKLNMEEVQDPTSIEHLLATIRGVIIIFENNELVAYIPSCADLTHQEMKDYTVKVEHYLFVDCKGRLGEEGRDGRQAKAMRDKGMDEEKKKIEDLFPGEEIPMKAGKDGSFESCEPFPEDDSW